MTEKENGRQPAILGDWPVVRTAEAIPLTRRHIRDLAGAAACAEITADVELMACELLTNAVHHGSGAKMHVRLTCYDRVLRVEIRNAGRAPQMPTADKDLLESGAVACYS